jgi:hypothetical protein
MQPAENFRLIEAGFPCYQLGAEAQGEQSVGLQAQVNCLHAWWAKRRLTADRSASATPPDSARTALDIFLGQFGIRRLRDRLKDLDRVELIAYRAAQFTR